MAAVYIGRYVGMDDESTGKAPTFLVLGDLVSVNSRKGMSNMFITV